MKKQLFSLALALCATAAWAQPAGYVSLDAFEPVNPGVPTPRQAGAPAAPLAPNVAVKAANPSTGTAASTSGTQGLPALPTGPSAASADPAQPAPAFQGVTPAAAPTLFDAVRGASLRATLEQWARQAGWQPLAWKLPEDTDFTLGASARFEGDFVTATRNFVASLGAEAELRVRFNQGNRLAVVEPLQ